MGRKGQGTLAGIGVILLVLAVFGVASGEISVGPLSGAIGQGDQGPTVETGKNANVDVRAKDVADTSDPTVAVPAIGYAGTGDVVTSADTNTDGSRVSLSGYVTGDNYYVWYGVDNATYYGDRSPGTGTATVTSETVRSDGEVHRVVSSGNLGLTLFDDNDNSLSDGGQVTVGSGETYRFDAFKAEVNNENTAYNWEYVYINDTRITADIDEWRVADGTSVEIPKKLDEDVYSAAFRLDQGADLANADPVIGPNGEVEIGQIALDMSDGADPAGEVDICTDDGALYQADDDSVKQDNEDQDDNDLGLATQCFTVDIQ